MNPSLKRAFLLFAVLTAAAAIALLAHAQNQTQIQNQAPPINRTFVLIDPAHGGPDSGATLGDRVLEKDVTLALAARLRTALVSTGFVVATTRDVDPFAPLPADQRAEIANRVHPSVCIVLHATATGSGVHLYTSTLQPADTSLQPGGDEDAPPSFAPVPWEMAQAAFIRSSLTLQGRLAAALNQANLPALTGRAPLRPLDNLMCPAVAIELAPLQVPGADATPASDPDYQQRIASTVALALHDLRAHGLIAAPAAAPGSALVSGATSRPAPAASKGPAQ